MKYETPKTDFIFSNDAKRQISDGFMSLREVCKYYKHLRNVGPTIRKRNKRSEEETNGFLGHSADGKRAGVFYEGIVGEDYLVDIVNLIGIEYISGETVS